MPDAVLHLAVSHKAPRGGWAWRRVHADGTVVAAAGSEAHASTWRLRVRGLLEGLRATPPGLPVVVRTSDPLLVEAVTELLPGWVEADFRRKGLQCVELFREMAPLLATRSVRFELRDRAHASREDALASDAAKAARAACDPDADRPASDVAHPPLRGDVEVVAWTDGGSRGNPGDGGWGLVLVHVARGATLQAWDGAREVTNNRMELAGIAAALTHLRRRTRVEIRTDSRFCIDALSRWLPGWKRRGWRKQDGLAPANLDLLQHLDGLLVAHDVAFTWVPGHAGEPGNERADALANRAMDALARGSAPAGTERTDSPPFRWPPT